MSATPLFDAYKSAGNERDRARRWSRAWKKAATRERHRAKLADNFLVDIENELRDCYARIAKLEDVLRKARPLLRDIMDIHRDPEDGEYHECDTDPCAWCAEAKELVEKPNE